MKNNNESAICDQASEFNEHFHTHETMAETTFLNQTHTLCVYVYVKGLRCFSSFCTSLHLIRCMQSTQYYNAFVDH